MTRTLGSKKRPPPQESQTREEQLIDSITEMLNALEEDSRQGVLMAKIKKDLDDLKSRIGESAFKVRSMKSREPALQQFMDDFPSMLGYWNRELINIHSNRAYAGYFGKQPEEIRGRTIRDLLGEKIFRLNLPYITEALAGKFQAFERDIPTPEGTVRSTLANYIPHIDGDEVVGFFVVVTDISEMKRLELRTKTLEASLYEQSRLSSLGQMASGIAHEINNPVAIIYSGACLAARELKKPQPDMAQIRDRLSEIETTALRIEKIVDGLRAVAQGAKSYDIEKTDLLKIVDQVLSICKSRFANIQTAITWSPPTEATYANCNRIQIAEILLNILNNAYDATAGKRDSRVHIAITESDDSFQLAISNNGEPISAEQRKNLFVPFFTTKGKSGTGLGLKISRDLAIANGGNLTLSHSAETEFVLTLPKAQA